MDVDLLRRVAETIQPPMRPALSQRMPEGGPVRQNCFLTVKSHLRPNTEMYFASSTPGQAAHVSKSSWRHPATCDSLERGALCEDPAVSGTAHASPHHTKKLACDCDRGETCAPLSRSGIYVKSRLFATCSPHVPILQAHINSAFAGKSWFTELRARNTGCEALDWHNGASTVRV